MRLDTRQADYNAFCETASVFWRNNTNSDGDGYIVVEALHQDIRVTLRNLTIANAIRRFHPAKLVLLTGTDRYWFDALWTAFDVTLFEQLGEAFGANLVVDIHA